MSRIWFIRINPTTTASAIGKAPPDNDVPAPRAGIKPLGVSDAGRSYDVVIVGSPNVNPGYKLVSNVQYPEIAADYANGFRVLKSLPCDVFLGAHGGYFDMEAKYAKLKAGGTNPYIDSAGYKNYVADREQAFLSELQKQKAAAEKH